MPKGALLVGPPGTGKLPLRVPWQRLWAKNTFVFPGRRA